MNVGQPFGEHGAAREIGVGRLLQFQQDIFLSGKMSRKLLGTPVARQASDGPAKSASGEITR